MISYLDYGCIGTMLAENKEGENHADILGHGASHLDKDIPATYGIKQ